MTPRIKLLFIFAGPIAAAISLLLFWAMLAVGAEGELLKFDNYLKWEQTRDASPEIHFESTNGETMIFIFPPRCADDSAWSSALWTCFKDFLSDLIATHPKAKEIMKKHQIEYKKG